MGGLWILDISDPIHPVPTGHVPGLAFGVAVAGRHAYVASTGELRVVDISNPANPQRRTTIPALETQARRRGHVTVSGNRAYHTRYYDDAENHRTRVGIAIADMSDPDHPDQRGEITTELSEVSAMLAHDNLLYIAGDARFDDFAQNAPVVDVWEVSDPDFPTRLSRLTTWDMVSDMVWQESRILAAGGE